MPSILGVPCLTRDGYMESSALQKGGRLSDEDIGQSLAFLLGAEFVCAISRFGRIN